MAKYLMFDVEGVLDGTYSKNAPRDEDLLIQYFDVDSCTTGLYQVLKDGVAIIDMVNSLVSDFGFEVVLHSKCLEVDQIALIKSLIIACQNKEITFPKITAMAVRDEKEFKGRDSNNPCIIKNREHGIWIAGYDKEDDGKNCVRNALSKLLSIQKRERINHVIFDDGPGVIALAKHESWQGYEIGKDLAKSSLFYAVSDVYEKVFKDSVQTYIGSGPGEFSSDLYKLSKYHFEATGKRVAGGSSPSIQWFRNPDDESMWIGKCSQKGIGSNDVYGVYHPPDPIDEYKEYIAIKLHGLFGVKIPEVILSEQRLSENAQLFSEVPIDFKVPRLQYMSRFMSLKHLGKDFFNEYKKQPGYRYYKIQNKSLQGLGRALAVAKFLYDFDCIGNSGSNMGYVSLGKFLEVVKVDAGEALPFLDDMSSADGIEDQAINREMLMSTKGEKISFFDLNQGDQIEYVLAVRNILNCSNHKLECIFKEVISRDDRFVKILEAFIDRKLTFLNSFSPELRKYLTQQIQLLQTMKAEEIAYQWTNLPKINDNGESQILVEQATLDAVTKDKQKYHYG